MLTFLQEPLSSKGNFTSSDNSSLKQFYNPRSQEIWLLLFLTNKVARLFTLKTIRVPSLLSLQGQNNKNHIYLDWIHILQTTQKTGRPVSALGNHSLLPQPREINPQ